MKRLIHTSALILLSSVAVWSQEVNTASLKPADQEVLNERACFIGGNKALNKFFISRFNMDLINETTTGKAYFEFTVSETGEVSDVHRMNLPNVIGFSDQKIEDECIRILQLMPAWKPAVINGKNVLTNVSFPVLIEHGNIRAGN